MLTHINKTTLTEAKDKSWSQPGNETFIYIIKLLRTKNFRINLDIEQKSKVFRIYFSSQKIDSWTVS